MKIEEIDYGVSGIYKITFENNKMYIGLSNDIRRRLREHLGKDLKEYPELLISKAILKHKIKDIEILELIKSTDRDSLRQREIYWIEFYNTFKDRSKGYNMTPGGDGASAGIDNTASYLSQDQLNVIYNDLLNSRLTYEEIAIKTNSSYSIISRINCGTHYRNDNYEYPLRSKRVSQYGVDNKFSAFYNNEDKLANLINDLKENLLNMQDIATKYNVHKSLVYKINKGISYQQEHESYPLRDGNLHRAHKRIFDEDELNYIKSKLENKTSMQKIALSLNCDRKVISDINKGVRQFNPNWNYPLKK